MANWKDKPYPYWDNQEWYAKRNEELLNDRAGGMPLPQLMEKYDLTHQRIYAVLDRIKFKKGKHENTK